MKAEPFTLPGPSRAAAEAIRASLEDGRAFVLEPGRSPLGRPGRWIGWGDFANVYLRRGVPRDVVDLLAPGDPAAFRRSFRALRGLAPAFLISRLEAIARRIQ